MSGREFLALWAFALTFTGLVVGWAFLVQAFGLSGVPTVALGVGVPVVFAMAGMWALVSRA